MVLLLPNSMTIFAGADVRLVQLADRQRRLGQLAAHQAPDKGEEATDYERSGTSQKKLFLAAPLWPDFPSLGKAGPMDGAS